jgi:hypothetical protein
MFDNYYYTKVGSDYIIYAAKALDKNIEMLLYKNEVLLDSTTGMLGEFELKGEDALLRIKNSALKSNYEFEYEGQQLDLKKVKLKALRRELTENNIFNAINPTKEEIEAGKFDASALLVPIALMVLSLVIQYFVQGMGKTYEIVGMIPAAIGGWMLSGITAERMPSLNNIRKLKIGFAAAAVILVGVLGEFLFSYF